MDTNINGQEMGAATAQEIPQATLYESPFAPLEEEKPDHMPMDFGTELADIKTKNDLTEEERKVVDSYVSQIDLNNSQLVIQYGAGAQKKIADFSEGALNNVPRRT